MIRLFERIDTSKTLEDMGINLVNLDGDNIRIEDYLTVLEDAMIVNNYEKLIPHNMTPILLDRAIDSRLEASLSLTLDRSNGKVPKSVLKNILGMDPTFSMSLTTLRDDSVSIWSYLSTFNGYFVAADHSVYTNQYQTSASFLHHYFGDYSTRDLTDGGLIIAVQNFKSAIDYQYSVLPFDKDYDFFGIAIQNMEDGVSFWKAHGIAFIKSFGTRSTARELPIDHRMWMDMMMDNVQIASYSNLIIFNKFAEKFILPMDSG